MPRTSTDPSLTKLLAWPGPRNRKDPVEGTRGPAFLPSPPTPRPSLGASTMGPPAAPKHLFTGWALSPYPAPSQAWAGHFW